MLFVFSALSSSVALADERDDHDRRDGHGDRKTVIYFTRHENDQSLWVTTTVGTQVDTCIDARKCCAQVLNPLGEERAARLADWFDDHHITERIDWVIATHKPRTVATVLQIAKNAGLANDDDGTPDGVQQIPPRQIECDITRPDLYDATSSMDPQYAFIHALPLGTTAVVSTHSTTLYQILFKLGIDARTDPIFYPLDLPVGATTCDPASIAKTGPVNSRGCKVLGFNNLWRVEIGADGHATATDHWVLDLEMNASEHDHVGRKCNKPDDHDDNGN